MSDDGPSEKPRRPGARRRFTDIRRVERTGSTNADVLELGRAGEPEGVVVVAESQSAGRGRHGRTWVAPPRSSMLLSALLRPPAADAPLVTAVMALAASEAVAGFGGEGVGIKWPNDLVIDEPAGVRKLAGVLAEADWPAGTTASDGYRAPRVAERLLVVAGIGLNVVTPADLPPDLAGRAIALDEVVGREVATDAVVEAFLDGLDHWYDALLTDRDEVLQAWRSRCVTLGVAVRVDLGADDLEGTAVDLDDQGRLVVRTLAGPTRAVAAGDVVHLRRPNAP